MAFNGEVRIWEERGCQHKCHALTLRRQGICDCCLIVGTTSFVLDCQRFPGCWMWMRMLVKPVGAADVQPGGALRSDRRPAEEECTSSINHEARPRARRESLSLQHISLLSYFNCNIAETILEYWLLNQSELWKNSDGAPTVLEWCSTADWIKLKISSSHTPMHCGLKKCVI